ncbi:MAG: hypothetical protein HRU71_13795 [Planctomycetia bacterium]|nr:MAG: hypothetical protein HRU71_13795 [Planctomycetia bacterium]
MNDAPSTPAANTSPSGGATPPGPEEPSPRAFCHATGFVYQSAGFLLALSTCCWWSFTGRFQAEARPAEPDRQVVVLTEDATAAQKWSLAAVCVNFIGGLALTAAGIGLQSDRLRSGRGVMTLTASAALFHWSYFVTAAWTFGGMGRLITSAVLALAWTVFFLLAGVSHGVLRRHPPARTPELLTSRDADALRNELSLRSRDKTNP